MLAGGYDLMNSAVLQLSKGVLVIKLLLGLHLLLFLLILIIILVVFGACEQILFILTYKDALAERYKSKTGKDWPL